jgi:MFS family permease
MIKILNRESINLHGTSMAVLWMGWLMGAIYVLYKFVCQANYAVLSTDIAHSLNLSISQVGLLGSIYTMGFAATTLLSGALLDFYGARRVLTVGIGIVAVGAYVFSVAESWPAVVAGQLLMGAGSAFGFPGAGYIIRHAFGVANFGLLFGLVQTITGVATAFSQGAAARLLQEYSWRDIMLGLAFCGLVFMICMSIFVRDREKGIANVDCLADSFWKECGKGLQTVLSNSLMWGAAVLSAIVFASLLSITVVWGVKLLTTDFGFDSVLAANINGSAWLGTALGSPLIAVLARYLHSYKKAAVIYMSIMLVVLITLVTIDEMQIDVAYTLFFILGMTGGGASVLGIMFSIQINAKELSGTSIACVNFLIFLISGLMMYLPGELLSYDSLGISLQQALILYPVVLMLALVFLVLFYKERDILPAD